jgi:hypothetical protein
VSIKRSLQQQQQQQQQQQKKKQIIIYNQVIQLNTSKKRIEGA